ncbi:MAG: aliphatic sulfonate ABC transporter substrate-binding protein [Rhodovibrionaceae bacterium]
MSTFKSPKGIPGLKTLSLALGFAVGAAALGGTASAADDLERIGIDYAYYNPVALLLKEKGWVEEEFEGEDIEIDWVLSLGSNKALEFLNGSSIDFGSTAGAAALLGKANGNPIKSIYVYSKPEWTALVTRPDTGIAKIEDLEGKRVAVTRGTDPHIFLLRALDSVGLTEKDIKVVLLQHPDGFRALDSGQVDAWAGLDPHMAKAELESGAELFFRAPDLNTYGILNVREAFAAEHPEIVERVLAVYERGRLYALDHPEELNQYLQDYTKVSQEVAAKQLGERTDLSNPVIGAEHRESLLAAGQILQDIGLLNQDVSVGAELDDLIDTSYIESVQRRQQAQKAAE